jgi:hypothetical protein
MLVGIGFRWFNGTDGVYVYPMDPSSPTPRTWYQVKVQVDQGNATLLVRADSNSLFHLVAGPTPLPDLVTAGSPPPDYLEAGKFRVGTAPNVTLDDVQLWSAGMCATLWRGLRTLIDCHCPLLRVL